MDDMVSASSTTPRYPKWLLIAVVSGICLLAYTLIVLYGFQYFSGKKSQSATTKFLAASQSSISGIIDLNGVPPDGSIINVEVKKTSDANFHVVITSLAAVDGVVWSWNEAESNTEYILQAVLVNNGQVLATSKKLVVIAPAGTESLRINVPTQPAPSGTQPVQSSISGTFNINGYIPAGSSISIAQRQSGTSQFTTILTGLPATDNSVWAWTSASQNTLYELQATLISNGVTNAQSQVISVTAPADGETLALYSTAQPPSPTVVGISGTISLNGYVPPSGSYITLGVRPTGTGQFTQLTGNISATDGVAWNYPSAISGNSYDIQAYLWQNGSPYSQSQILTLPAPATNEVLTINAQTPPTTTPSGGSISISCNSYNSSVNLWQITVTYNTNNGLPNPAQYVLYVGTNQGGNQQINLTTTPSTPNQSQSYVSGYLFSQGTTYYAQYAYATCSNCSSFSPFSPALTFSCNPAATPTPTNTPTPTPTNTPIPTPTNTPIPPTNTPMPTPTNTPPPATNTPVPPVSQH